MSDVIRVSEIFGPTIQGEGALIGQPTVFVRTGGCDYRCDWCDSLHAVESEYRATWAPMAAETVMAEVARLSGDRPIMVTLSGGNPAIQPLGPLITAGRARGYRFALETQGSIARDWFADLDMLVLSPKPPSSGMSVDWAAFEACLDATSRCDVEGQRPTEGGREAPALTPVACQCFPAHLRCDGAVRRCPALPPGGTSTLTPRAGPCSRSWSSTRPTTYGRARSRGAIPTCRSTCSPATTPRPRPKMTAR